MKDNAQHNIYEYGLRGDWKVLAGKTDVDNDFLSLKMAKPNDSAPLI